MPEYCFPGFSLSFVHVRVACCLLSQPSSFCVLKSDLCTAGSAQAVDRNGLENMLRRLEAVDLDSVSRVSDSKVTHPFRNVNLFTFALNPHPSSSPLVGQGSRILLGLWT